jgi:hypothetical protein
MPSLYCSSDNLYAAVISNEVGDVLLLWIKRILRINLRYATHKRKQFRVEVCER